MSLRFDEKGKYYTEVIAKDVVPATLQTQTHHIRGHMHIRKGERVSDELNNRGKFLALTEVTVYDEDQQVLFKCKFLAVNLDHIVWLMPDEELIKPPEEAD